MSKKIVVVDDEESILYLTKKMLESRGYQVIALTDDTKALETVKTERPDLVIMDMLLKTFLGTDICHDIKSDPALKNIPVLITSGALSESSQDSKLIPPDDFLTKPFEIEELLEKIEKLIK